MLSHSMGMWLGKLGVPFTEEYISFVIDGGERPNAYHDRQEYGCHSSVGTPEHLDGVGWSYNEHHIEVESNRTSSPSGRVPQDRTLLVGWLIDHDG